MHNKKAFLLSIGTLLLSPLVFSSQAIAQETVNVLLQEWRIVTDVKEVKSGPVKINVQNRGRETHEIVVLKTDLPHDQLPLLPQGGIDEAHTGTVIDEIEDVREGSRQSLSLFLKPGRYVILCNMTEMENDKLEVHYSMGMRQPLIVN